MIYSYNLAFMGLFSGTDRWVTSGVTTGPGSDHWPGAIETNLAEAGMC